jgi:hypothetical protein
MFVGDFEQHFRDFIRKFGGTVLPEGDAESADFLFSQDNVVAELKTLQEDARQEHATKLNALVADWRKRGLMVVFGTNIISLEKLNRICQGEWLHILQAPVERIVRKANRQIRTTKQTLQLPNAKGLLLIANDGNLLHTSPKDYMILISRVLQKKTPTGELQFPHILGVIYFSYRIGSAVEGMPFWFAGDTTLGGDVEMRALQERLSQAWFSNVEQATGQPVTIYVPPRPQ